MRDKNHIITLFSPQFTIKWAKKKVGFGQFTVYHKGKSKRLYIANEFMSKDFIKKIINKLINDAVLDDC